MLGFTLIVSAVCSLLALFLPLPYALASYIASMVWYPEYLRISIGTIDISVGRVVGAILFARCLCNNQLRSRFVWNRLDTWIVVSMVIYVVIYCFTRPFEPALENRGGFLMDTWLAYMTVRLIMTDRATLASFLKAIGVVLTALAAWGVMEAVTHWQPFWPLMRFLPWGPPLREEAYPPRWGLSRATGPFGHPLMFGLCFIMFLPLFWALRRERQPDRIVAYLLSAAAVVGALSSMSSGTWVTLALALFCIVMERYRRWVKQVLIFLVVACVLAEIGSNNPLHHVIISRANPLGGAGWQRAALIDYAIKDFDKWWLAGYGGRDPGWAPSIQRPGTKPRTDLNNIFLHAGVDYGIWGLIIFCTVYASAIAGAVRVYKSTSNPALRAWAWAVGVSIIATIIAGMGVSFFGSPVALLYCIFGLAGSLSNLQREVLICQGVPHLYTTGWPCSRILEGAEV